MLVRLGTQVQEVLRRTEHAMIMGDEVVEQVLAGLEQVDRGAGQAARAAYGSAKDRI